MLATLICEHVDWSYNANSADGKCLVGWENTNNLALLHNQKDAASFYTGRWHAGTNPDLAFVSIDLDSRLPDRHVLENSKGLDIEPRLLLHQGLLALYQASQQSNGTFARPSGATILLSKTNLPGLCRYLIHLI